MILLANAGSPLMLGSMLHLLFGNFGIGVLEGLAISLVFKRKCWLCIAIMIAANYFSAWVGYAFLGSKIASGLAVDIYSLRQFLAAMILATYLMTLALEWPFVAACFWKAEHWFRKSIVATLMVQTASYALIFGWYWVTSSKSLLTDATAGTAEQIRVSDDLVLYYITDSSDVRSLRLRDGTSTVIGKVDKVDSDDRLIARWTAGNDGTWELLATQRTSTPPRRTILSNCRSRVVEFECDRYAARENREYPGSWGTFYEVPRLGLSKSSDRQCEVGFYAWEGLRGSNSKSGETWRIALEVPFLEWMIRNAVEVPDDKFIFQLGDNQICIFDARSRKIALLARGHGPVVALEDFSVSPVSPPKNVSSPAP